MTTDITVQPHRLIGGQAPAVALLSFITDEFSDLLPGGYIKIHQPVHADRSPRLDLQLNSPQKFEAWRDALGIDPKGVHLLASSDTFVWLQVNTTIRGVPFELTGFGVPLTAEQAETPQLPQAVAV